MERRDLAWKDDKLSTEYLEELRGAIPLAKEQIETISRIVRKAVPDAKNFLDLGCGNGILGAAIIDEFPSSTGVFLDFSHTMLEAAKEKVGATHKIVHADYSESSWVGSVADNAPFDIVVSGLSIHHQTDERKKEIYSEIYGLLSQGGVFLNLEHVASKSEFGKELFLDAFVDSLIKFYDSKNIKKNAADVYDDFKKRDEDTNVLSTVEEQCRWLTDIGYKDVDCYMKFFEIALFGGKRDV